MELVIAFDTDNNLILATLTGPYSLSSAQTTFMSILEAIEQHQAAKALVDARLVTGTPKTFERYEYGTFVADAVHNFIVQKRAPVPKFVYVMQEPLLDRERFGESVAVNRGMWVRAFDNLVEAAVWLQIPIRV